MLKRNLLVILIFLFALPAFSQQLQIIPRQKQEVYFGITAVSNKGLLIAASCYQQPVIALYEAYTGKEMLRYLYDGYLKAIHFSSDDNELLLVFSDRVEIYDLHENKIRASFPMSSNLLTSAFNSTTSTLAVASGDSVYTYQLAAGNLLLRMQAQAKQVHSIKFSTDGKTMVSYVDNALQVRNATTGNVTASIPVDRMNVYAVTDSFVVQLLKEPYSFIYYNFDGSVADKEKKFTKAIPQAYAQVVTVGDYFIASSFGRLILADNWGYQSILKTDDTYYTLHRNNFTNGYLIANAAKIENINPDGNVMSQITEANYLHQEMIYEPTGKKYIILNDSLVQFSNGKEKNRIYSLSAKYGGLQSIEGNMLTLALTDGTIEVWNTKTEKREYKVKHKHIPYNMQLDVKNQVLYLTDFVDQAVYQYQLKDGKGTVLAKEKNPVTCLLFQDNRLYYGTVTGDFKAANISGNKLTSFGTVNLFGNGISAISAFKNDLLVSSFGRSVALKKDLSDTSKWRLFIGHNGYITSASPSPDQNYFVTAAPDHSLKLWDLKNERIITSYSLDSVYATRVQIDAEEGIIFYGPDCMLGAVTDTVSMKNAAAPALQVVVQSPNNNPPTKLVINKQGNLLASTDHNTVKVRDLKTGFLMSEFSTKEQTVNGITFSADGKMLAVATGSGIECFDPYTGTSIRYIDLSNSGRSIHDVEAYKNDFVGINIHGWHNPLYYHKNSGLYDGQFNYNLSSHFDNNIFDLKFSEDDSKVATYGSSFIKMFELVDNHYKEKFAIPVAVKGRSYACIDVLDFSPDGKYLMYAQPVSSATLTIVSTTDGKIVRTHNGGMGKFGKDGAYVYMSSKNKLVLANINNESERPVDTRFDINIIYITYNKEADMFAAADEIGNLRLIEGQYGYANEIDRWDQYTYHTEMSPDNNYMTFNNQWGLYLLDMQTLSRQKLPAQNYPYAAEFSPAADKLYFTDNNNVFVKSLVTGKVDSLFSVQFDKDQEKIARLKLSSDGKILYAYNSTDAINFYDVENRKLLWKVDETKVSGFDRIAIYDVENHGGKLQLFAAGFKNYGEELGNTPLSIDMPSLTISERMAPEIKYTTSDSTGFAEVVFKRDAKVNYFSPRKTYRVYMKDLKLYISDTKTSETIFTRDNPISGGIEYIDFDSDENKFLVGFNSGVVEVYDLTQQGQSFKYDGDDAVGLKRTDVFKTNSNGISSMKLYKDLLLVKGTNEMVSLFDMKNHGEKVLDMVFIKDRDQVFLDKDGYYYSTKNASKYLAFKQDRTILPFERFDYLYNRPDKVMAALEKQSIVSPEMVKAYKRAYEKRVEGKLIAGANATLPVVAVNSELIKQVQYKSDVVLPVTADGNGNQLSAVHVMVNGLPFFGSGGKSISGKQWKENITVPLTAGKNTIKVFVSDNRKIESNPEVLAVNYVPAVKTKPDLYIIAVSVADYLTDHDLTYPQKDGRDIVSAFASKDIYQNVHVDTLFNSAAVRANFMTLKTKLAKAKPDDQVVVFFSGHGLLDKKYDFYYATYDCDFDNPAAKGISYGDIESLLDSIAPRKKLLLIDACHSGEFDKGSIASTTQKSDADNSVKGKGIIGDKKIGLENSFHLMQDLFGNLNRGSGTVVISAAAGDEQALEADRWKNGVFTWALLSGLKDNTADTDRSGNITVSEIREYVYRKVSEQTKGKQKPTTRQENLEWDWVVW